MPPTMGIYSIWGKEDYDSPNISLDCLLPSGFLFQIDVQKDATILSIKKHLWNEVKRTPIQKFLEGMDNYMFSCIDEEANKIEITDENRRLCDVRPFYPVLKLIKQQSRANEDMITNAQISVVIGKDLREFDQIQEPEVVEFRRETRRICARHIKSKSKKDWLELAMCYYPPDLAPSSDLPEHLRRTLMKSNFQIYVSVGTDLPGYEESYKRKLYQLNHDSRPGELVEMVLDKQSSWNAVDLHDSYVLKVVGLQEYLLGDVPLSQFVHVRNAVSKEESPKLVLVSRSSVEIPKPSNVYNLNEEAKNNSRTLGTSILDLRGKQFSLTIKAVTRLVNPPSNQVLVRACLYHGGENLCGVETTNEMKVCNQGCLFNELCTFNIELRNIPRMARLCFVLYSNGDKKAATRKGAGDNKEKKVVRKKEMIPIAWVNIPVFDYKGMLRVGNYKMMMWKVTDDDELSDELLNPIGTVEMNPLKEAICLDVTFDRHTEDGLIHYPPFDKVLEVAAKSMNPSEVFDQMSEIKLDQLKALIEKDPLYTMCEQDKELMWNMRFECQTKFPSSLPKLLTCVKWNNHADVAQMQSLLQIWQHLEPTDALELLDFPYADQSVRSFAVQHVAKMSDNELRQYLLQLVQVSKYESYLECDLIKFLLERALNNAKIGHEFFWLLKSEMHVPSLSVKFGLILEAYCRANLNLMGELSKEIDAINNIRVISEHIKVCGLPSDKIKDELKKGLENKCKKALSLFCCPLNPRVRLKAINIEKCKCMDSKMKPLWLVWENIDPFAEEMLLMYKRGDDLRQDMLTLQILKIMDSIWQSAGLDLRLNIYNVLPTAQKEGLIEVVKEAKTLANIQLQFGDFTITSPFNKKCIFQWLQKENTTSERFEKALNEFTLSCAGYSVATYVLGVADRHSDNIMIRKNGQLFHIDFGHILGNFKMKWGVKRERCPFVLTADFVYVIKRGEDKKETYFQEFQKLCEKAFCILRSHSKFLIILFMMMMNTGIPEVSCLKDIEYLKETLVPHKTEQEALEHFRSKFTEALKDSWKTSLNHMCHNINKVKGVQSVRPN